MQTYKTTLLVHGQKGITYTEHPKVDNIKKYIGRQVLMANLKRLKIGNSSYNTQPGQ